MVHGSDDGHRLSSAHYLEKKKEKNKNRLKTKIYMIGLFLFYTQAIIEGVSDLGSIVVLLRGEFSIKTVIKCY
jgi:hypothetical protein